MTVANFPYLGFDPARGNVSTVDDLAKQMKDTGTYAKEAYDTIKAVQDNTGVWAGEAARAFAGKLGELPKYLDDAHLSLDGAAKALSTWGDHLEAHQRRARELEDLAREAVEAAKRSDAAAEQARAADVPIAYDASDPAAAQAAKAQADANARAVADAVSAANGAWDKVEDIRRKAEDLRDRWEDDGRICAESLEEAAGKAPDKAFLESFGELFEDAGKWLKDHLGDIGDIAGIVAAVAGALAFIPVLTPIMGPVAIAAGAVALLAHGADMVLNEKWDDPNAWVDLGGDVLGVIPGVGAISKGFGAAGDAIAGVDKLVDVGRASGVTGMMDTAGEATVQGVRAFAGEAANVSGEASKFYQWVGNTTIGPFTQGADEVAKAAEASVNIGLEVPNTIGLAEKTQQTEDLKNAADIAGLPAGAAGASEDVGKWIGKAAKVIG
ncbi:MAG: hypothetical protein ACRDQF_00680 [Thermocrispum sp.]